MKILVTQMLELPNVPDAPTTLIKPWADNAIRVMRQMGHEVIHLVGPQDTTQNLLRVLQEFQPQFYVNYGHGFRDVIISQNQARAGLEVIQEERTLAVYGPLIDLKNSEVLSSRVAYVVSCQTAAELGPDAVRKGAISYVGWSENYEFGIHGNRTAPGFEEVANAALFSLLNGATMAEAVADAKRFASDWMDFYWSEPGGNQTAWAALMRSNRDSLVALGNQNARLV